MDGCMNLAVAIGTMAKPVDPNSFYALFAAVARAQKMTPGGVIKKAGLTPQAGEKWKKSTDPEYATKVRLAKAMNVPVSRLLRDGEHDEGPPAPTALEQGR